jgi:thiol-disulfide isomerase/thioredoxin
MNQYGNRFTLLVAIAAFTAVIVMVIHSSSRSAPDFSAKTLDGERFTKETLKGKVVLIQFWATWCGYCRRDQPALDAISRDFAAKGLVVLAVNTGESRNKVRRYLDESPRTCNVVFSEDTNLAEVFRPHSFPKYVLIGRDGNIAGTQNGSGGEESLRQLLSNAGLKSD